MVTNDKHGIESTASIDRVVYAPDTPRNPATDHAPTSNIPNNESKDK